MCKLQREIQIDYMVMLCNVGKSTINLYSDFRRKHFFKPFFIIYYFCIYYWTINVFNAPERRTNELTDFVRSSVLRPFRAFTSDARQILFQADERNRWMHQPLEINFWTFKSKVNIFGPKNIIEIILIKWMLETIVNGNPKVNRTNGPTRFQPLPSFLLTLYEMKKETTLCICTIFLNFVYVFMTSF